MRAPGLKHLYVQFSYPGYRQSFEKIALAKQKNYALIVVKGGWKHEAAHN
jgi:hypothetical protein